MHPMLRILLIVLAVFLLVLLFGWLVPDAEAGSTWALVAA